MHIYQNPFEEYTQLYNFGEKTYGQPTITIFYCATEISCFVLNVFLLVKSNIKYQLVP